MDCSNYLLIFVHDIFVIFGCIGLFVIILICNVINLNKKKLAWRVVVLEWIIIGNQILVMTVMEWTKDSWTGISNGNRISDISNV